jgi:hypothetical protein
VRNWARATGSAEPITRSASIAEWLTIPDSAFEWLDPMTFIIEATRDDHRTADIRSSVIDAVILARKLAADGFAVSISTPAGRQYGADQFKLLLTSENLNSQGVGEGGKGGPA